jgi:hypothetical protein
VKSPVLVSIVGEPADFAPLFDAGAERGVRIGWLELDSAAVPPPTLSGPPFASAFRAVAVGREATVVVKPRKGAPVLRDLIREHFLGADVVLVKGLDLFPKLRAAGDGWALAESAARERRLSLDELFARLRKPELRWRAEQERGSVGSNG